MSPVAVSADRRFHRAHVKPARKRGRLRRYLRPAAKYAALLVVLLAGLYRGVAVLADASILQIHDIVVLGNRRVPKAEVLATLEGLRGENIVWTDLDRWRDRVLASPWVRSATFRRSLPSTIEVEVAERSPMAIGRLARGLFLVDERGVVIDTYGPQYADLDLPIIDGLEAGAEAGAQADGQRADLAARLLAALRPKPKVAGRVSQVDVTDPHNASVILNGDRAVIYVGEDRFLPRLESYLDLSAALRERVADIDYVDLRFDERIYVRPAAKAGRIAAIRGGEDGARPRAAVARRR